MLLVGPVHLFTGGSMGHLLCLALHSLLVFLLHTLVFLVITSLSNFQ